MKYHYSLKIGLFILAFIEVINGITRADLCRSALLDEGLLPQENRYDASGICKQTYVSFVDGSAARRFCRKRFPVYVTSSLIKNGKITCQWVSRSSCPSGSTHILGNCYKMSSKETQSSAGTKCGKFGMDLAYITSVDVAFWIATLFYDKASHYWVKNKLNEQNPLIHKAIDPVSGQEVVVSDGPSYKSDTKLVQSDSLVISTIRDEIYGISQTGSLIKADPSAKFPTLCSVAAESNDPKVKNPLLPYTDMSHNQYTFTNGQIKVNSVTTVDSGSIHNHCLAQTGQVCSVPKTNNSAGPSDVLYWVSADLRRSNRKDYNACDLPYDLDQQYLLYDYVTPSKTVGIRRNAFAKNEPKPMCSDVPRVAVQADSSGMKAVPPIIRRPFLPGPDSIADVERLTCDCVSKPPTTVCDPKTKICKCAKDHRPVKDPRYISGYKCVGIPTSTVDPCAICKKHSKCVRSSGKVSCECDKGYEDAKRPGEVKNGVCKKICNCGTGATCIDDEGTCACVGNMIDVLTDPNRQISQQDRNKYKKTLHCATPCNCPQDAHCKRITSTCECSQGATDAHTLKPEEYEDIQSAVTGPGQLCLLHTCKQVKQNMQLAVVMDHSFSIDSTAFEHQRQFLISLAKELNPTMTTLHLVPFSTYVGNVSSYKHGTWTIKKMVSILEKYPRTGARSTATPAAVLRAYQKVMSENDPHKAIFLLTDGEPNCITDETTSEMRKINPNTICYDSTYVCNPKAKDFVRKCLSCLLEMGDVIRSDGINLFGVVVSMRKLTLLPYSELHSNFEKFVGGRRNIQEIDTFQDLENSAKQILQATFRIICRYVRKKP